jgi:hypothetical protein
MGQIYKIHIEGPLDETWSAWFDGLAITPAADGGTLLSGPLEDQAALHGILMKIRDLGLTLVSVTRAAQHDQKA